jgi:hypothetical protein
MTHSVLQERPPDCAWHSSRVCLVRGSRRRPRETRALVCCGVGNDEFLRGRIEVAEPNCRLGDGLAKLEEVTASDCVHLKGHPFEIWRRAVIGLKARGWMKRFGRQWLSNRSTFARDADKKGDEEEGCFQGRIRRRGGLGGFDESMRIRYSAGCDQSLGMNIVPLVTVGAFDIT